jgi:hypothetical protein
VRRRDDPDPSPDPRRTDEPEPPPDRPAGVDEETTAREQRRGRTLDERLADERPEGDAAPGPGGAGSLVDRDRPDVEPELVGELSERPDDAEPAAEEAAMSVRREAPGGTDDESDGYVTERERSG